MTPLQLKIYILVVVLSLFAGGLSGFVDFIVNLLDASWTISLVQFVAFYNVPLQILLVSLWLLCFYLYNIKSANVEHRDALKALGVMV